MCQEMEMLTSCEMCPVKADCDALEGAQKRMNFCQVTQKWDARRREIGEAVKRVVSGIKESHAPEATPERVAQSDVGAMAMLTSQERIGLYTPTGAQCVGREEGPDLAAMGRWLKNQSPKQPQVDTTLAERGSRYGKFVDHAQITQDLKAVMQAAPKWKALSPSQKEALEMIQHKVGRILNGDPNYADSWHDIAGYATLVDKALNGDSV